jgi:hypothetical protein
MSFSTGFCGCYTTTESGTHGFVFSDLVRLADLNLRSPGKRSVIFPV